MLIYYVQTLLLRLFLPRLEAPTAGALAASLTFLRASCGVLASSNECVKYLKGIRIYRQPVGTDYIGQSPSFLVIGLLSAPPYHRRRCL